MMLGIDCYIFRFSFDGLFIVDFNDAFCIVAAMEIKRFIFSQTHSKIYIPLHKIIGASTHSLCKSSSESIKQPVCCDENRACDDNLFLWNFWIFFQIKNLFFIGAFKIVFHAIFQMRILRFISTGMHFLFTHFDHLISLQRNNLWISWAFCINSKVENDQSVESLVR